MADAMERVRAAEQRYNAVIERTAKLDTHITAVDQHLTQLETEARATLAVLGKLKEELRREEDAAIRRAEAIVNANRIPAPWHRWFWPVAVTALFFGFRCQFFAGVGRVASGRDLQVILSRRRPLWACPGPRRSI